MKREHVTLPTLQLAATAFFATTCQAKPYCVDESTSEVVATENCHSNGDIGGFIMVDAPTDDTLGAEVARRDDADIDLPDMTELANRIRMLKLAAGGFGRRGPSCECDSSGQRGGGSGGGGFVGGVVGGGHRGGRGGRGG